MDFTQKLGIFVAVAEAGGFARAAEAKGLSRPSVTNAVAALEAELGARLFQRTTRRTTLTPEGEALFDRAVQLLADVAETRELFTPSERAPRGRLRVDVPVSLARPVIIPRLAAFTARHPGVELVLGVGDADTDLVAEGVDCVLRLGELPASSLVGRVVGQARMVTCAAPAYLERYGTPAGPDELAGHRAVNFFSGRTRQAMPFAFSVGPDRRRVKLPSGVMVNNADTYVDCALEGLGLIQPLRVSVASHLETGRLVEVLPELPPPPKPVAILYPHRRHVPLQVRAFIAWVENLLRTID